MDEKLILALPDGHLMNHVLPFIKGAGLFIKGYEKNNLNRRPVFETETEKATDLIKNPERIAVKVIRPQDMPTHVANGNFDIAVSGTDWLYEHKLRFPKSPVIKVIGLGFGKVKIVAAVHRNCGDTLEDFIRDFRNTKGKFHIRIASEYVYIADNFARARHLYPYKIIMTYGATESLIPEDCDMIIENTETGGTLRKNNLKIIETLNILGDFSSEGCLIGSKKSMESAWKKEIIQGIKELFEVYMQQLTGGK